MVSEIFNERILTVREVAELLHVHPNTVRMWNNRGLLKAYRLGSRGDRRFTASDLGEFLNRNAADVGITPQTTNGSSSNGR